MYYSTADCLSHMPEYAEVSPTAALESSMTCRANVGVRMSRISINDFFRRELWETSSHLIITIPDSGFSECHMLGDYLCEDVEVDQPLSK